MATTMVQYQSPSGMAQVSGLMPPVVGKSSSILSMMSFIVSTLASSDCHPNIMSLTLIAACCCSLGMDDDGQHQQRTVNCQHITTESLTPQYRPSRHYFPSTHSRIPTGSPSPQTHSPHQHFPCQPSRLPLTTGWCWY
ncbi:hypothetical protein EX30DRAFT_76627 [Ascodesmis nigricans]|uniref:Uncharacterized protein n=1 Tax=Ascodesmis nigricans TaxID=341454 RepID=A0A4V3SIE5_9PEZI|nr:hypothetical protein EX30DRAFT_76627 [Ascodesmis nigricans]